MRRRLLLIPVLFAPLVALGQNPSPGISPVVTSVPDAAASGYPYGYVLSTPIASFPSPPTTAGISEAGRAGISESAPANNNVGSSVLTPLLLSNGAPGNSGAPGNGVEAPGAVMNAVPAGSSVTTELDLGPSFYGGAPAEAANNMTLGEIAARYGKKRTDPHGHIFTNADLEKLASGGAAGTPPASPPEPAENSQNPPPLETTPGDDGNRQNSQPPNHQKPSPGTPASPQRAR